MTASLRPTPWGLPQHTTELWRWEYLHSKPHAVFFPRQGGEMGAHSPEAKLQLAMPALNSEGN